VSVGRSTFLFFGILHIDTVGLGSGRGRFQDCLGLRMDLYFEVDLLIE
jgi:hypothetical protein